MSETNKQKKSGWFENTITQAQQLDREAFETLYSNYLTPLYRYFVVRTSDRALSEDLAHTVFIKAWEHSEKLNDPEKTLPWLFAIARNTLIDYWRKKKEVLVDDIGLMEEKGGVENIEDAHEYKIKIKKIWDALQKITEDQREILTLKFFEGMTNEEICLTLGKSAVAVRALQYRALNSLKNILKNETE
jgi:RNA polymerase sigma-70 factor (ECF subfamily)